MMKQAVSFFCGMIFLILGLIGLALPVIPQIPFLLLSIWFFSISSTRFRRWVVRTKWYQKYAREHVGKFGFIQKTFEQEERDYETEMAAEEKSCSEAENSEKESSL